MAVTSLWLCSTVTFYSALGPIAISVLPRGSCPTCCKADLSDDVSFLLYTRTNPKHPQRLFVDRLPELEHSFLRRNHSTVFYLHGFTELAIGKSSQAIKSAYLRRGDYNVILVDWSPLSSAPWYEPAARNAEQVGRYLARFITFLHRHAIHASYMHVIGFSLGAEAAGFAGKALKNIRLPRITGLDPAYPLYRMRGWKGHLIPSDADFVDVIHTDGGVFGFATPLGHVDFFPNGGIPFQPGCRLREAVMQKNLNNYIACSHNRAWMLYAETVNDVTAFPAERCSNYGRYLTGRCLTAPPNSSHPQYMGLAADPRMRGKFFLKTRDRAPYSTRRAADHG